jgi:hypothetical protein
MSKARASARATLDAWREQGADRFDPIRFHVVDALEKRAARQEGEARRLLDERLSVLLDAYAAELKRSAWRPDNTNDPLVAGETPRGPFGELMDRLADSAAVRGDTPVTLSAGTQAVARPELELLGEFRKIWSSVRTESQLRQSMAEAPENSGPLNSRALVQRAIGLMRELSPGYLQHFLAYVDDLSWIEQMNSSVAYVPKDAAPAASPKKRTRKKRAQGASEAGEP